MEGEGPSFSVVVVEGEEVVAGDVLPEGEGLLDDVGGGDHAAEVREEGGFTGADVALDGDVEARGGRRGGMLHGGYGFLLLCLNFYVVSR